MASATSSSRTDETQAAERRAVPESWEAHESLAAWEGHEDELGRLRESLRERIRDNRPVTGLLFRVAHLYRQAMAERLKDEEWLVQVGFRPPCIGAMMAIAAHQPLSQRELSAKLGVDPSDLVKVIDIIQQAGFVSRQPDPDDRRRRLLVVTPEGWKATHRLAVVLEAVDDVVLSPLSDDQRAQLRRLLAGVVTHHV